MAKVDFDRGAVIRLHPSGARICMYVDDPGVYFDMNSKAVEDDVAGEAGFEVEVDRREKRKREALARAQAEVEREFTTKGSDYDRISEAVLLGPVEVKHVGAGRYALYSSEGERITQGKLSKEQAEEMLAAVAHVGDGGKDDGKAS